MVAVGDHDDGQCDVTGWRDIVAVAAGNGHTVGLKSDGSVATAGSNEYGKSMITKWKLFQDIHTIQQEREEATRRRKEEEARQEQLRKEEEARQEQLRREEEARQEQLRKEEEARQEQERKEREAQQAQWRQENRCQYCGGAFKGLFTKKCAICKHVKDY